MYSVIMSHNKLLSGLVVFTLSSVVIFWNITTGPKIIPMAMREQMNQQTEERKHSSPRCDNQARVEHVRKICEQKNWTDGNSATRQWIIVDHKRQILFCLLPKVASSTIRNLFGNMIEPSSSVYWPGNFTHFLSRTGFHRFTSLTAAEQTEAVKGYFKFMVVRHPFVRLMSAWKNKLTEDHREQEVLMNRFADILQVYMNTSSREISTERNTLSFADFVTLVSRSYHKGFKNMHWMPMHSFCSPCDINYDYIYHLETFQSDMETLQHHLEIQNLTETIPDILPSNVESASSEMQKHQEISILIRAMNVNITNGLLNIYERDFKLYGYHWDPELGASCGIKDNTNSVCC